MLLEPEKSKCSAQQKIIVSKDEGTSRQHRAINLNGENKVRHYKLDGELIYQEKCCDFLLLNDTQKLAYFIELKGSHIDEAIPQLESGFRICRKELSGYQFLFRIVCSKVLTHDIKKNSFRKFKDKYGSAFQYSSIKMEEKI